MSDTGLRALAESPQATLAMPLQARADAHSLVTLMAGYPAGAEAFRALRTHVMARHVEHGRRAIAICAASPGVGCTSVASNLAISLSQIGLKTLLIDANMRNPGAERHFEPLGPVIGLRQFLLEHEGSYSDHIVPEVLPDLSIMFAGGATEDAQELLASDRFSELMSFCLRDYDMTVLDTPAANFCSDGLRISNVVGYSLIVVRRDKTRVNDIRVLAGQLEGDGARVVGTVMTEA